MACFAIGDIHGADQALAAMLAQIDEHNADATLWFVGDLVNRGPDSTAVIRHIRALGERAITLLGNHDLSLLSLAQRPDAARHANPSLRRVLEAPDCETLLEWLRFRPLIHRDRTRGWTMVHAGIPREWSIEEACERAAELESVLQGPHYQYFLRYLFGNTPDKWDPRLEGIERLRYIANALTRQRFVYADDRLDMRYKKTIAGAPPGLTPWFAKAHRQSADERIVFGHWSALGRNAWPERNVWGIDTGASWGGPLTALALDERRPKLLQVRSEEKATAAEPL